MDALTGFNIPAILTDLRDVNRYRSTEIRWPSEGEDAAAKNIPDRPMRRHRARKSPSSSSPMALGF